jgi:hypothetical protein
MGGAHRITIDAGVPLIFFTTPPLDRIVNAKRSTRQ